MIDMLSASNKVSDVFDRLAPTFDSVVTRNPINAWMHQVSMEVLGSVFLDRSCLLELGCGTGSDAIDLARRGHRVFAFDISRAMVERARAKVLASGLQDRVVVVEGRSRDLLELVDRSPWVPFDGAYANFTLTYERNLERVAESLAKVLRPGAFFVGTLPNRLALSELIIYGLQLRFGKVLRRLPRPLLREVDGSMLEIRAYSPQQVRAAFSKSFALEALVGIPTFVPPPYLHQQYRRLGAAKEILPWLDVRLARHAPWNRLGDHTLFKFRRK